MDDLYRIILDLPPRSLTLISTLIGLILIDDLSPDEQIAVGNLLILLAQTMVTNGATQRLMEARKDIIKYQHLYNAISELKDRVIALETVNSNK